MKASYWLTYPADYEKQLKPLLHQQMWLFGQDILWPKGNLLYQYHFTHTRPDDRGGAMYSCFDGDRQIVLWGWGIWFGHAETGAVFVNRFKGQPQFTEVATLSQSVYRQEALPSLADRFDTEAQVKVMCGLWTELLCWLSRYEAWVLEKCGISWRQEALQPFPHAFTPLEKVDQLAVEWQSLAEQSQTLAINSSTS